MIPASGLSLGLGLNDGLRGQELERTELRDGSVGVGVSNRVGASVRGFFAPQVPEIGGRVFSLKGRLGDLFGSRSSVAAQLAIARSSRAKLPAQDDVLTTIDLAVPAEFLLTDLDSRARFGAYVGPRFTHEVYRDRLNSGQDLKHTYSGALVGIHLHYSFVHVFGEATVLHVPTNMFRGQMYGGRLAVMPAAGVFIRFGSDHDWKKRP